MGTVIISLILAAIIVSIIFKLKNDKKAGKSSCGCGCSSCPMSGECRKK